MHLGMYSSKDLHSLLPSQAVFFSQGWNPAMPPRLIVQRVGKIALERILPLKLLFKGCYNVNNEVFFG